MRSLSSLALSRSADRNAPGRYSTASTRPVDRRPLHVHVEDREEHAHPRHRHPRQVQLGRRDGTSPTVATVPSAGGDDDARRAGRHPAGRAEEGGGGGRGQHPGARCRARCSSRSRPAAARDPGHDRAAARVHRRHRGPDQPGDVGEEVASPGPSRASGRVGSSAGAARSGRRAADRRETSPLTSPQPTRRQGHSQRPAAGTQRAGAVIPRDDDPGLGTARPLPSDGRWALCCERYYPLHSRKYS